jgi:glycosyltransferase involved in cell wall biosynthesis
MPRFAKMLTDGMKKRGHKVEIWSPEERFYRIPLPEIYKKWLGYIDQYILFPLQVRKWLNSIPSDTLFVFADHALGPWVPLVKNKAHVIHCHDFLAQRSAIGQIPENITGFTGKKYQKFIRNGYSRGQHFISVSEKTKNNLAEFLKAEPLRSDFVYNGLNSAFLIRESVEEARAVISEKLAKDFSKGYILHVGGNQWYKNRVGVVEIYNEWRKIAGIKLPLLLIGQAPDPKLLKAIENSLYNNDIYFESTLNDDEIRLCYTGASVFLFPSLAEGFGWPIAEAMACGCPVITTGEAPMTEVGGNAALYILRKPYAENEIPEWIKNSAITLNDVLNLSPEMRRQLVNDGIVNTKRFNAEDAIDKIETIYKEILNKE